MTAREVITAILDGEFDEDLERLRNMVGERRKMLVKASSYDNMKNIAIGDRVRLLDIRPKYMVGQVGTVTEKRKSKFTIVLDEVSRRGRFSDDAPILVPASGVEKI